MSAESVHGVNKVDESRRRSETSLCVNKGKHGVTNGNERGSGDAKVHISSEMVGREPVIRFRLTRFDKSHIYVDTYEHKGPIPTRPRQLAPISQNVYNKGTLLTSSHSSSQLPSTTT